MTNPLSPEVQAEPSNVAEPEVATVITRRVSPTLTIDEAAAALGVRREHLRRSRVLGYGLQPVLTPTGWRYRTETVERLTRMTAERRRYALLSFARH